MARVVIVLIVLLLTCSVAAAQGCGNTNPNCSVPDRPIGDSTNSAANTKFVQTAVTGSIFSSNNIWTGTNTFNPITGTAITVNPAAASLANGIVVTHSLGSGTAVSTQYLNSITVTSDQVAAGANNVVGLIVNMNFGGSATGQRVAGVFQAQQTSVTNSVGGAVGMYGGGLANASMGGTNTGAGAKGGAFGANTQCQLLSGATNQLSCVGIESDALVATGASTNTRAAFLASSFGNLNAAGTAGGVTRDAAYMINAASGSPGFLNGILIADSGGGAPLDATNGCVICIADATGRTIKTGIDLSGYTISGNFLNSVGFSVTGAGAVNAKQTVTVTGTTNDGYAVTDSTVTGTFASSALHTNSVVIGTSSNHPVVFIANNAEVGSVSETATTAPWVLGVAGTRVGSLAFGNVTSGTITLQPTTGALGSSVLTLPALTGTVATTSVAGGGTGAATFTANGVLYGNGTSAIQVTAQGAANSILTANAGAPVFSVTPTIGGLTKITSNVTSVAADANTMLQIIAPDAQAATEVEVRNYGGAGPTVRGYLAANTAASPMAIAGGGSLWNLAGFGYGTSFLSTPDAKLIMGSAETFSGTAHGTFIAFSTTPTTTVTLAEAVRIQPSGALSVGTTTDPGIGAILANTSIKATTTLTVAGMANVATTSAVCYNTGTGLLTYDGTIGTCTVSDERLKNMGPRIAGALDKLLQINGIYYTWRDPAMGSGRQIGLGAQTVERVFPELVQTDSKGTKSLDYVRLAAPIIEALRELKADNDNLRSEMTSLRRRNTR